MTSEYIKNSDGTWMDADEIFNDLIQHRITDDRTKEIIAKNFNFDLLATAEEREMVKETGLNPYGFHYQQFGMWIRNSYGLWAEENPHTNHDRETGADDPRHPDNYSAAIIDRLTKHFSKEPSPKD